MATKIIREMESVSYEKMLKKFRKKKKDGYPIQLSGDDAAVPKEHVLHLAVGKAVTEGTSR